MANRYVLLFLVFMVIAGFMIYRTRSIRITKPHVVDASPSPHAPAVTEKDRKTIVFNDIVYAYEITNNTKNVRLIANFTEKLTSIAAMETYHCTTIVNGGFYDTDHKPLGLFITDGKTFRREVANRLIDGFLWFNGSAYGIGMSLPETIDWAIQNGPLLLIDNHPLTLTITDDKTARRAFAFISHTGKLGFGIVFSDNNRYSGPLLSELPKIISSIAQKEMITLTNAINLDGGSASAYISNTASIGELQQVGSFFCLN